MQILIAESSYDRQMAFQEEPIDWMFSYAKLEFKVLSISLLDRNLVRLTVV